MRRPAGLVFAAPKLHGIGIAQDAAVFRVDRQFAVDFPGDVGKLQHGDGDVADRDGSIELFALADSRDEVREVRLFELRIKNWLLHNDEICTLALRRAGTDPHGCTCRLNQVLHINVPEGKFITSHGEFDPL